MRSRAFVLAGSLAVLVAAAPTGAATQPLLAIEPSSGTPGSKAVVTGTGWCPTPRCKGIEVLFAGVPVASAVSVRSDGRFSASFQVPPASAARGSQNVAAIQRLADGNEQTAFTTYLLVYGKGEQAEQMAEINDFAGEVARGESRRRGSPRGVPLASFAAATTGADGVSSTAAPRASPTGEPSALGSSFDRGRLAVWLTSTAGGCLALAVLAVLVRRPRGRHLG